MAKQRKNLTMRFPDAIAIWERVIENNGLVLSFDTQNDAIAANFRLQRFRKAYRDTLDENTPLSAYDRFKVRVPPGEAMLIIEPIQEIEARVSTLAGDPITLERNEESLNLETDNA